MPKPKKPSSSEPVEKTHLDLGVVLEEIRSQQKLTLEGVTELNQRVERVEFRLGRLEQQGEGNLTASIAHSNEIRRLQHDVQVLQHEVAKLREGLQEHQKAHATT